MFGRLKLFDHLSFVKTSESTHMTPEQADKAVTELRKLAEQYDVKVIMKVSEWLQNYADEHNCFVSKDSLYVPMYHAFKQHPKKRYDEEDGEWYWSCACNKRRCDGECDNRIALDKLIPKTLIDDLAFVENPILYNPKSKENN